MLLENYPKPGGMKDDQFAKLVELCGSRWVDLLLHIPRKVLDRTQTPTVAEAPLGERATVLVKVVKRGALPPRGVKRPLAIDVADASGRMRAVFFNPGGWLERAFPVGQEVILSGKMEEDAKGRKMIHPDVWAASKGLTDVAKLAPLYPLTAGLPHGWLSRAIAGALEVVEKHPPVEWLPVALKEKLELPSFSEAVSVLHNPSAEADVLPPSPARTRLATDELYASQIALSLARASTRGQPGIAHGVHKGLRERFLALLPYKLTSDQLAVIADIDGDLAFPRPMLRLVQGDVGSGKTMVALMALLRVIENGHQGVLMAPTELLAKQHFAVAKKYFEPLGLTVGLLVGSQTTAQKKRLKEHVRDGFVNLLVGTHALVEGDLIFDKLGLAVIDEQHRFGVKQRVAISANTALPPDVLVMTATPIPRTLALTAYGDMEVSVIKAKPPGRVPVHTVVMPDEKMAVVAEGLLRVLAKGQQAYWVCPLVEESEDTDLAAATQRFEFLERFYGGNVRLGLLHGKMKPADKEAVMGAFQRGEVQILVSTTVIEVGVDVPNACVMVIEHAERFGLSQLHQLRGRVGRGSAASQCILLYSQPLSAFAVQRLQVLRESEDGFYLAEKDLELRGPGEILGTAQSGHSTLMLADLYHHQHIIPLAREAAEHVLGRPLNSAQKQALGLLLEVFRKEVALPYLRAG